MLHPIYFLDISALNHHKFISTQRVNRPDEKTTRYRHYFKLVMTGHSSQAFLVQAIDKSAILLQPALIAPKRLPANTEKHVKVVVMN